MATNTAASFTNHTGNGTAGPFSISFSYLSEAEVDVTVGGVFKTLTTHYTFTSATQITFTSGNEPGNGVAIKFQRDTDISAKKVDFEDGSVLTETDLDTQNDQVLFAQQEILDKLSGIEEGATADQTDEEIRTAVGNATNSNVFTDAEKTKLTGIDANAKDDQTASEIKTLIASSPLDASHLAANSVNTSELADDSVTYSKLQNVSATDRVLGRDSSGAGVVEEITPANLRTMINVEDGATADQTNAEIKTAYEANSDTNAFTDAEKTKLNSVETNAKDDQSASDILSLLSDQNIATTGSLTIGTDIIHSGDTDTKISFDTDQVAAQTGGTPRLTITNSAIQLSLNTQVAGTFRMSHANGNFAVNNSAGTDVFTVNSSSGNVTTSGTVDGRDLATDGSKLDGIEASADVTDATNVDAAGAVMNSDLDGKGELLVGDGSGDPTALAVGQNGYILTADSTEATGVKWAANAGGGGGSGISNVVEDTTPQLGGNLDVQTNEITTSTTNGNIKLNPNGTGVVEVKGDGSSADGTIQLNCSQNSHGIKLKSPPHSAGQSYTLTFPSAVVNDGFLKTDANGNLSFAAVNTDLVNDSSPQLAGTLDTNGQDVDFKGSGGTTKILFDASQDRLEVADNASITFGDHPDVQIAYSNGHDFHITGIYNGLGNIVLGFLNSSGTIVKSFEAARSDGAVELYYSGTKKFETTSTGVKLGADNDKVIFGSGGDFEIFYNGTNTVLSHTANSGAVLLQAAPSESSIRCNASGSVEIYYDNSKKFETFSTGVKWHGFLFCDDNSSIRLGNGADLQIYHDGSHSYIKDEGTGNLLISSNGAEIALNKGETENMLRAFTDGAVELFYDGSKKFETTANGVEAGQFKAVNTFSPAIYCPDNSKAVFGTDQDLQIYHDGSDSYFASLVTGNVIHRARRSWYLGTNATSGGADKAIHALENGAVELYYDDTKKLATKSNGVELFDQITHTANHAQFLMFSNSSSYFMGTNTSGFGLKIFTQGVISTGVELAANASSFSSISDENKKTNLQPIENGIDKIKTVRAVTGRYKTDEISTSRSFLIAQDFQKVLPEAVGKSHDDSLLLSYTETIPLLVAAIKESITKIETLETKVAALESA